MSDGRKGVRERPRGVGDDTKGGEVLGDVGERDEGLGVGKTLVVQEEADLERVGYGEGETVRQEL